MPRPTIEVESDYDGFFESLVSRWIDRKEAAGKEFKHSVVGISAGPWRSYAVSYSAKDDRIHLDFYSAVRTGFGDLSSADVEAIIDLL